MVEAGAETLDPVHTPFAHFAVSTGRRRHELLHTIECDSSHDFARGHGQANAAVASSDWDSDVRVRSSGIEADFEGAGDGGNHTADRRE
jgi:hypothetical protein